MMMSASFSLKMMRIMMAVTETGSMSGKTICQKLCQPEAPSTLAASSTSRGSACRPARIMIIMNGMKFHASISMIVIWAISGEPKKEGLSQPSQRAKRDTGPKRTSIIDLPIIHETATGDSISGSRKTTRQNLRATICALSSMARPKATAYSTRIAST